MELLSIGTLHIYIQNKTKMNCQNNKVNQGIKKDSQKNIKKQNKNKNKNVDEVEGVELKEFKVLYVRTGELKVVSKERFSQLKGAVIEFKSYKVRVIGEIPRCQVRKCLLEAQGGFSIFSSFTRMITSLVDTHGKVVSIINGAETVMSKINKRFTLIVVKLLMEFVSFARSDNSNRLDSLISICMSIFSLIDHFDLQAQGLETILLASALPFLPNTLQNLIKHITLLSNTKILDDFSLLHRLFELLENFLLFVTKSLGVSAEVTSNIIRLFSYIGFGSKHRILSKMKQLMDEAVKDKRIFNGEAYRRQCKDLNAEFDSCTELLDWSRRSGSVGDLLTRWRLHLKIVDANEEISRVEPNLFVFEGPPACGKSIMLNQVIAVLGGSNYCHSIPDVNEGKDFYDSYNFEDIFYMDDVGQKGISQWRTIINMVSSVKMPLECAEAKLKDTKFFKSHTILASTNQFMTLGGLCKSDGIANIEALWRRAFIFDCNQLKLENGLFRGEVVFRHFDLAVKRFQKGFPAYLKLDQLDKTGKLTESFVISKPTSQLEGLRVWMGSIVKAFELKKRNIQKGHIIPEEIKVKNLSEIKDIVRDIFYPAESSMSAPVSVSLDLPISFTVGKKIKQDDEYLSAEEDVVKLPVGNHLKSQGLMDMMDVFKTPKKIFSFFGSDISSIIFDVLKDELLALLDSWGDTTVWKSISDSSKRFKFYMGGALCVIAALIVYAVYAWSCSDKSVKDLQGQGEKFTRSAVGEHNSVEAVMKNVYECSVRAEDVEMSCQCLVSGRMVLLPAHLSPTEEMKIKIYRDKQANHVWLEYTSIEREFIDNEYDIALYSLPKNFPSPFKSVSQWFGKSSSNKEQFYLISGMGFRKIDVPKTLGSVSQYSFRFGDHVKKYTTKPDYMTYDVQANGLCGSVLFSTSRGILGIHVAGHVVEDFGVATMLSGGVLSSLREIMEKNKPVVKLDFEFSDKIRGNSSVVQFYQTGLQSHTPDNSSLVDSALYGIYPVDRFPADLKKFGSDTLKEVSKKSFTPCVALKDKEIRFCRLVLDSFIDDFGVLNSKEVVVGTPLLAGLNKDSSNGFGLDKDKSKYIDFDQGVPTPHFEEILKEIESKATQGSVDWQHLVWQECLKDELRNEEKEGVPRSFRIGTLSQQFLVKKYFGRLVEHIMQNRGFNKIMVGCNPIKEWPSIYQSLCTGKVFAGDIKNWDGSMNAELQQLLAEFLVDKSTSNNKNLLWALVGTLTNSLVVIGKDTFLTTHSMPSGSYLTAIMNSIINKLYTAIWYFRNVQNPTIVDFWKSVDDFVYGDDKLNVVRKHHDTLNAITMKEFFESVNMGFTDSVKKPIVVPFQDISEVTFLKRSFVYHNLLKKVVCPLELRVIQNTLSYYMAGKDQLSVLQDKIHAAQREFYLHSDREFLLSDFYQRLDKFKVPYNRLSMGYMKSVYADENVSVPVSFGEPNLYF